MIAILERTQSNVQQNIEHLQTPTMGVTRLILSNSFITDHEFQRRLHCQIVLNSRHRFVREVLVPRVSWFSTDQTCKCV